MDKLLSLLLSLAIYSGVGFVIAHYLGRKRQIGYRWSFFFFFFLSPIGGFIITMLSKRSYEPNPEPSKTKKISGWVLIVLCLKSVYGQYMTLNIEQVDARALGAFFMNVGLIGLGYYLIELSNGKSFNTKAITKTVE